MRRVLLIPMLLVPLSFTLLAQPPSPTANWIWFDEGDPLSSAPAGKRYFRYVFDVAKVPDKANLEITADNGFVVWVNGTKVGEGNDWHQLERFDVRKHLKQGKNVLAVEGTNDGGPAGLVAWIKDVVVSDKAWKASKTASEKWQTADFDDKGWKAVKVLGLYGKTGPWGGGGSVAKGPGPKPRGFVVPEGFKVELGVKKPDDRGQFSIVNMCFDAKGRLLLSQEGGPTLLCIEPDKDGVYQKVVPYCEQVKNSQGMCWVGDALLLVGNGPKGTGLYRCKDIDKDDKIDKVELLHQFQGGMGEHGPHAVIHGPDGWLYVVVGNHAWCKAEQLAGNSPLLRWPTGGQGPDQGQPGTTEDVLLPRLNDANGHAANIRAPGGTIWRMDQEGKNLSLFSAGYRNQFDAAFNPMGELFSYDSDMEWDEGLPWYRHVRACHATPGSDFVWRTGAANTPNYYLDSLPPTYETGRGSPVGVEVCDHSAFPDKYRGAVFLCDWSIGVIYAMHNKRDGGSYKATVEKFCTGSPMNVTDCAMGPDGALWFTLGGRGSQGGVHRVVPLNARPIKGAHNQPLSAWGRAAIDEELKQAEREEGGRLELFRKFKTMLLNGVLPVPVRLRMVDAMQRHGYALDLATLLTLLGAEEAELRAKVVYFIGVNEFKDARKGLLKALSDEDALVRRRACEALVRAGIEPPVEALGPVLVDDDPFVRTAARLVLQRIDPKKWTDRFWKTDHKGLLREGVVALCKIGKANDYIEQIFDRLHEGSPGEKVQDILDYVRTIQLALIHTSKHPGSIRGIALDCLEMFPHKDANVNRELAIVLTQFRREKILDEPVHEKILDALLKAREDRPQQIHYFYCLRLLHEGWTKEQLLSLLSWYEATRDWKGGASFQGFLDNIFKDLTPAFTKEARVEVLAKAKEHPRSAFALLKSATVEQLPTPEKLHELLTKLGTVASLPRGGDLKTGIVEAIGRFGTPEARTVLVKIIEEEPSLRAIAALGLSKNVTAADWPYLVKALDTTNKQALFEIVQALKKSAIKPKPEDATPFRAALLAASKLDPNNRWQVVELMRHWAGNKRFSAEEKDWKGELSAWSKWFGQTFPKESALPDVASEKPPESKWKYAELLAYLDGEGKQGDVAKGRIAFEKGQCLKCHKYGKEGEGLGPDLTTLSKRFKRSDTLDSMFHPSKVISDQYRSTTVVTTKGQAINGLAAPQGDMVTILQSDGTKITLKKSEIEQQLASLTSVMPERLLDLLTKEEIRDLFAFLESEPAK